MYRKPCFFFSFLWMIDKTKTFWFCYMCLCHRPPPGPDSLIIQIRAGQAVCEPASGRCVFAPHPEVLQTSLCTVYHVMKYSFVCISLFLHALLSECRLYFCLSYPTSPSLLSPPPSHFLHQFAPPNNYMEKSSPPLLLFYLHKYP